MPLLGLGTWLARGKTARQAVQTALELGYRHLDTASMYGNEEQVGRALAESAVPRDDVFVTTKMWPDSAGRERATLEASLAALRLDFVDLWLVHWPPAGQARPDIWERFLEAEADGLARSVGVSNYSVSTARRARAGNRAAAVGQSDRVGPGALRRGDVRRASAAGRPARGLQPAQDHQPR